MSILKHYFLVGIKADKADSRINAAGENETVFDYIGRKSIKYFKSGHLCFLEIKKQEFSYRQLSILMISDVREESDDEQHSNILRRVRIIGR